MYGTYAILIFCPKNKELFNKEVVPYLFKCNMCNCTKN